MVSIGSDHEAFPVGQMIEFQTLHDVRVRAVVVCFDPNLKVLVVRSDYGSGKSAIKIFNLAFLKDIRKVPSSNGNEKGKVTAEQLLNYRPHNNKKLQEKLNNALQQRREESMQVLVPIQGQKAFLSLRKLVHEVKWEGENIRVMNFVLIKAPYGSENVEIKTLENINEQDKNRATAVLKQVKKILSRASGPLAFATC